MTNSPLNLHILRASGVLTPFVERLETVLHQTGAACNAQLDLPSVDVVVMNVPWAVIPRLGTNGFAYDAHQIVLQLDVSHPHLTDHFDQAVRSMLCHELHHCARAAARGSSHGQSYGGSLVAEGLACCFEQEMGLPTPLYAVECQGQALQRFAAKACTQVKTGRFALPGNPNDWMFGCLEADDPEFPYQCGYSTGYRLVRDWLDRTGQTSAQAAGVDEDIVLKDWVSGGHDPFATIAG